MNGAARLRAKIARMGTGCRAAAEQAVQQAAEAARDAAAANAPVETGRLRGSIRASVSGLTAEVSAGCEYAAAVELGSRKHPAQPYLLPAAQESNFAELAAELAAKAMGR